MTVNTHDNAANCNVDEASNWLGAALNDAITNPGVTEAQVTITYLEEDGDLVVVTGQLDSSDRTWDCRSQSHTLIQNADVNQKDVYDWGYKKFNQMADQMQAMVDDIVPRSDRASECDVIGDESSLVEDDSED
jgi:hypothetical protein